MADATKRKIAAPEVLTLLAGVETIVAARGQKIVTLNLKANRPTDEEILAILIGPTGNLRAPTARVGKTMLVGFNEEAYRTVLDSLRQGCQDDAEADVDVAGVGG